MFDLGSASPEGGGAVAAFAGLDVDDESVDVFGIFGFGRFLESIGVEMGACCD
jgi:hypothetical protein